MISGISRAICRAIVNDLTIEGLAVDNSINQKISDFVERERLKMVDYLIFPFGLLLFFFSAIAIFAGKLSFATLSAEKQQRQINNWRYSYFSFCRELIRFYDSLVTFALFSLLEGKNE